MYLVELIGKKECFYNMKKINYTRSNIKTKVKSKKIDSEIEKKRKEIQKKSNEMRHEIFQNKLKSENIKFIPEYKFNAVRNWRIDYYFEMNGVKVGLEIEGGVFAKGRHTRGKGFMKDIEKYNSFSLHGIYLIRTVPVELNSIELLNTIKSMLKI